MKEVQSSEIIAHISQLAFGEVGGYAIVGQYRDHQSLADSLSKIRRINGVRDIEFHNAVIDEGSRIKLTSPQKRILRVLLTDPRMSISDIANESGLSARRVRKEIEKILESQAFHLGVRWNLSTGQKNQALIFTHYENDKNIEDYYNWLYNEYELEMWASIQSALEPVIMTQIVTESMTKIPEIISAIRKRPEISHVRDYVVYRTIKFPWLADLIMNDIIA
jgi:DNA-binding Lrp family transcriptional regulator